MDIMSGEKLSSIQVVISLVVFWSILHSIGGVKGGTLFQPATSFTLLEYKIICCNIQVIINPLSYLICCSDTNSQHARIWNIIELCIHSLQLKYCCLQRKILLIVIRYIGVLMLSLVTKEVFLTKKAFFCIFACQSFKISKKLNQLDFLLKIQKL